MNENAPLIEIPQVPQPEGAQALFVPAKDGARLRVITSGPAPEARRGAVLVLPGWAEFAEKYAEVCTDLHARGFDTLVCDPRGQGYSQRLLPDDTRGHITDFKVFVDDLDACTAVLEERFAPPYFLLAHSMGGLIALEFLAEGRGHKLSGAVLSAPLTNLFDSAAKKAVVGAIVGLGRLLGRGKSALPGVKENALKFEGNVLTQDETRHERFRQLLLAAPEAAAGLPKFDWLAAALAGMERIQKPGALGGLPFEVLLVSATRDETVDPLHHRILAEAYPGKIRLVTVEGARHELLMERDDYRDQFFAAFDQYMDERMSPVPAASSASSSLPST